MAKSIANLTIDAEKAIAAGDWDSASETCRKLQGKRGGAVIAHRLRAKAFRLQGRFAEAQVSYQAAYDLGDHVAGGSAAEMAKLARSR